LVADLIISSYNFMGCDAFNIGAYDLSLGIDFLKREEKKAKFPFISANLCDSHGQRLFKPYLLYTIDGVKVGIFGLIDKRLKLAKIPGGHKLKVKDPFEEAGKITAELRSKGAQYIILLTNMTGLKCRKMGHRGLPINLIIGSSKKNQISIPLVAKNTYITHLDRGGKCIGYLEVKFLDDDKEKQLSATERYEGKIVDGLYYYNRFVKLKLSMPDHPVIAPKVTAVLEKIKRLQAVKATTNMTIPTKKLAATGDKKYVGVQTCRKCHPQRYTLWQNSAHARAYHALILRGQEFDKECIGCHSLGYGRKGGFSDLHNIGFYANVQCESCHGPGSLHVALKGDPSKIVKKKEPAVCLQCHIEEKSPEFNFQKYFHKTCSLGEKKK